MSKTLVFIHGAGDSARIWRLQMEHFASKGAERAVAIDLPGHGQRPDIFTGEVTARDYAHAVREIIIGELKLERPIIAGHSLGGTIALVMALEYGPELAGLILLATGARLRVHPTLLESAQQRPQEARTRLLEMGTTPANAANISPGVLKEQAFLGPTILYRDLMACHTFDIMTRLYEISLPTLIICGSEDRMTPVKYSEYLHKHIAPSRLHIIEGAGHYVIRERPEEVNEVIDGWMEENEFER